MPFHFSPPLRLFVFRDIKRREKARKESSIPVIFFLNPELPTCFIGLFLPDRAFSFKSFKVRCRISSSLKKSAEGTLADN